MVICMQRAFTESFYHFWKLIIPWKTYKLKRQGKSNNYYCNYYITDIVHNLTMQQYGISSISAICDIQTHRTGHTDRWTGGSLMVRLPSFQMNHGGSGIPNRCYQLNWEFVWNSN